MDGLKKTLIEFYEWLIDEYNDKIEFGIQEEMDLMENIIDKFEELKLNNYYD